MAPQVIVVEPEQMNLLGLLLKGFLTQQLSLPKVARHVRGMHGAFGLKAGGMAATLSFSDEGVLIRKGFVAHTRARVEGDMGAFVRVVASPRGGLWHAAGAILRGKMKIKGNPLALLSLLPVLTAHPAAEDS